MEVSAKLIFELLLQKSPSQMFDWVLIADVMAVILKNPDIILNSDNAKTKKDSFYFLRNCFLII